MFLSLVVKPGVLLEACVTHTGMISFMNYEAENQVKSTFRNTDSIVSRSIGSKQSAMVMNSAVKKHQLTHCMDIIIAHHPKTWVNRSAAMQRTPWPP